MKVLLYLLVLLSLALHIQNNMHLGWAFIDGAPEALQNLIEQDLLIAFLPLLSLIFVDVINYFTLKSKEAE